MTSIARRQLVRALAIGGLTVLRTVYAAAPPAGKFRIVLRFAWSERMHRENGLDSQFESFFATLARFGYVEGGNLAIERQFPAADDQEFERQMAHIRSDRVDALLTFTPNQAVDWQQRLPGVPIVASNIADPVAAGLARTVVKPGGNVTGVGPGTEEIARKQVDILRQFVPGLSGIAIVGIPLGRNSHPDTRRELEMVAGAVREAGLAHRGIDDPGQGALEALRDLRRHGFQAVMYWSNPIPTLPENTRRHADMAIRHRIATMGNYDYLVDDGFLASYGEQSGDWGLRLAQQVDRLLRGSKPAELPFINPSRFRMRVNRRTAATLGLAITPELRLLADEVIG